MKRRKRFEAASWAPSERDADVIIVRHAPKLGRDLQLEPSTSDVELHRAVEAMTHIVREGGVSVDEAVWNLQWAFGVRSTNEEEGP